MQSAKSGQVSNDYDLKVFATSNPPPRKKTRRSKRKPKHQEQINGFSTPKNKGFGKPMKIYKTKRKTIYAVAQGHVPGIYHTFHEFRKQIKGYSNPKIKTFTTQEEAEKFMYENGLNNHTKLQQAWESAIERKSKPGAQKSEAVVVVTDILSKLVENVQNCTNDFENSVKTRGNGRSKKYYAVVRGHVPGIYRTLAKYRKQMVGFSNWKAKSFSTEEEAQKFMNENGPNSQAETLNAQPNTCEKRQSPKFEIAGVEEATGCKRKLTSDAETQTGLVEEKRLKMEIEAVEVCIDLIGKKLSLHCA